MRTTCRPLLLMALIPVFIFSITGCSKGGNHTDPVVPPDTSKPVTQSDMAFWLTKADQTVLLKQQNVILSFSATASVSPVITVDTTVTYQPIDGFGYALTGGSAYLINGLAAGDRDKLLKELFLTDSNSIGVSYLRVSIGASDMSANVFSYDDSATPDTAMANFDLSFDKADLVPLLQRIVALNPSIKILGSPWSAPLWMKDNNSSVGGSLQLKYYAAYARYFVKYIQAMKAAGITIDAITPQNEPENPYNNPSMTLTAVQEAEFIKSNLGPAFQAAGLNTKIIVFDHNCDHPVYPLTIYGDADALKYADGAGFHLYAGDIGALGQVHDAYPAKNLYFTEQYVASSGNFGGDLGWHVKNLIIGASRNWSRNVLEWNLANDPSYGPHTTGGCSNCLGALTIGTTISRNVSYYIIAHAAKFVRPGSVRVGSNNFGNLPNVAFVTPEGKKVLIVLNTTSSSQQFGIQFKGKTVTTSLDAGAVGTFLW